MTPTVRKRLPILKPWPWAILAPGPHWKQMKARPGRFRLDVCRNAEVVSCSTRVLQEALDEGRGLLLLR